MAETDGLQEKKEDSVVDIMGLDGPGEKFISKRKKTYRILPSPLEDFPTLIEKLNEFNCLEVNKADGKSIDHQRKRMQVMAEIIFFGLKETHKDITVEQVKKEFTLSDFPKALKIIMDLNDFFAEMKGIKLQSDMMIESAKR